MLAKTYPSSAKVDKSGLEKAGFRAGENPCQLYVRAHLANKRIEKVELFEASMSFEIHFQGGETLRLLCPEDTLEVLVADRKPFKQKLRLADLEINEAASTTGKKEEEKPLDPVQVKYEKLRAKVMTDLQSAEAFLDKHQEIFSVLTLSPQDWGVKNVLSAASVALVEDAVKKGKIPSQKSSALGPAQDHYFNQRRRMQRKVLKARERLREIDRENPYIKQAASRKKQTPPKRATSAAQERKKFPGLKLTLDDELIVYVGRSASENAELFRKMKDRDLWFHVRAEKGAHVWIPRGQKALPAKAALPQKLIELGAQIALLNSRADRSASATVDYTERRYLRSVPGEDGLLRIERSETIFVRKDEALERRLFAGR